MKKAMLFGGLQAQNTFIGGIGATINTASSLASKLGISVSRISNFEVVGSEVRCRIFGSYALPTSAFNSTNNNGITSYKDGKLVSSLGNAVFGLDNSSTLSMQVAEFRNATSVGTGCFGGFQLGRSALVKIFLDNAVTIGNTAFNALSNLKLLYIPRCTSLGTTSGKDDVFTITGQPLANLTGCVIYANPALATNNAGNPDGDLVDAVSRGAEVRYVTNFDKPSTPTFTLTGGIYGTAIQINDIVCTGTNAIDYYEVWINGNDSGQTIKASGDFATSLIVNTSYDIQLVARDIFYNESEISSKVTASTATALVDVSSLVTNYYNLNSNINDSKGSINGTNYGGTFATGKVNNALTLDGTSQYATLPDNDAFSFPDDSDFSINFCVKLDSVATNKWLLNKRDGDTSNVEWQLVYNATLGMVLQLYDNNALTSNIYSKSNILLQAGVFYDITVSYKSGNFKIFINAINNSSVVETGTYVKMTNTTSKVTIGKFGWSAGGYFKGQLDCLAFFKGTALTQGHASDIKAIHDSGNDLI